MAVPVAVAVVTFANGAISPIRQVVARRRFGNGPLSGGAAGRTSGFFCVNRFAGKDCECPLADRDGRFGVDFELTDDVVNDDVDEFAELD